eukprot:8514108-Karenia_brevis.AAC.1
MEVLLLSMLRRNVYSPCRSPRYGKAVHPGNPRDEGLHSKVQLGSSWGKVVHSCKSGGVGVHHP